MSRNTVVINFSAPQELARSIESQAKKENKTKSELLRAAFSAYSFDQRLAQMQETGQIIAQKLGLESYTDIEKYLG